MRIRTVLAVCLAAIPVYASIPPADWVPARWNWTDAKSLDLLAGTPINCLLLKTYSAEIVTAAAQRGIVALAVIAPGGDAAAGARRAVSAKLDGIVLEGDFPQGTSERVRDALAGTKAVVVELTSRNRMRLDGSDPITGTYQGVWPGIQILENGSAKAAPSGAPWIDTNSGFVRAVRAWGQKTIWLGNLPPTKTVIEGQRYLQAVADAAMAGARWVVALDGDFASRLFKSEAGAVRDWKRMAQVLAYYEKHPEWRGLEAYGKLAIVQDPADGGLLSGGILDMIASRHTPVRAVPRPKLSADALKGATMAVNVDSEGMTPEQREILRGFARGGGTLLTGPAGWKDNAAQTDRITLEKAELERLNDIWHDVQGMIGRKNLGARLFNVSSMLSNLLSTPDGKEIVVQLVNYSSYPVESVAVHVLGDYKHARLFTPDGGEKHLELYKTEEGVGVDIDKISVCATVRLD